MSSRKGAGMGLLGRKKSDFTPVDLLVLEVGVLMEHTAERAAGGVGKPGYMSGYRVISEDRRVVVYRIEDRTAGDFVSRQQDFAARIRPALVGTFGRDRVKPLLYQGTFHGFEITVK